MSENYLKPQDMAKEMIELGHKKGTHSFISLVLLAILGGAYIALAAELYTIITSDMAKYMGAGMAGFMGGSVFSIGLILVVIGGAELFTGNCLMIPSVLVKKITWKQLVRSWFFVYLFNFVGALIVVAIIYWGGIWHANHFGFGINALTIGVKKTSLTFMEAFFRGVGCNWLVCLGIWLALASKDITGKILGIYFPVMAFIASGFEHSVANMYYMPLALVLKGKAELVSAASLSGLQMLTWHNFLLNNLLPVTLGNIVGGGLFVGMFYYRIYIKQR